MSGVTTWMEEEEEEEEGRKEGGMAVSVDFSSAVIGYRQLTIVGSEREGNAKRVSVSPLEEVILLC